MSHEVFICHSSKDAALAFSICEMLEKEGINCWIAPRNIVGGKLYAEEIVEAITNTTVFLIVFSQNANLSRHVLQEVNCAFNANKVILPYRIDDSKMSMVFDYYLNTCQIISAIPESDRKMQELKDAVIKNLPDRNTVETIRALVDSLSMLTGVPVGEFQALIQRHQDHADNKQWAGSCPESGSIAGASSGQYDMLQNAAGEILIITDFKASPPDDPRLVYDGGDQALMYRNRESAFMLNSIAPDARPALSEVEEVLVVEIENDDVAREYKVPVRLVRSLKALGE